MSAVWKQAFGSDNNRVAASKPRVKLKNQSFGNMATHSTSSQFMESTYRQVMEVLNQSLHVQKDVEGMDSLYGSEMGTTWSSTSIPLESGFLGQFLLNPSAVSLTSMQKMVNGDSIVRSSVDITSMLVAASIGPFTSPDKEIEDAVRNQIRKLGGMNLFKQLVTGDQWAGFSVHERVWKNGTDDYGYNTIESIRELPQASIRFRANFQGEIIGALQYNLFANSGESAISYFDDAPERGDYPYPVRTLLPDSFPFLLLDIDDLIHTHTKLTYPNPFGESPLRSAYTYWVIKTVLLDLQLVASDKVATNPIVAYFDKNQFATEVDPVTGEALNTSDVVNKMLSDMYDRSAGSVLGVPAEKGEGFTIDSLTQDSKGMEYINTMIEYCDNAIRQSMILSDAVTGGGGSYARAVKDMEAQTKILNCKKEYLKQHCLMEGIVRPFINANFGEQYDEKVYGSFTDVVLSAEEKVKMANIYKTLAESNFIDNGDKVDLNQIRQNFGFESTESTDIDNGLGGSKTDNQSSKDAYQKNPNV